MKRKKWSGIIIGFLIMGMFAGCSKDPASIEIYSDDEAIRQLVEENMDYITSAGLDDNGAQPMSYVQGDGLGKLTADITPIKFGRKGRFVRESIVIEYTDDLAIATIEFSFDGNFFVVAEDLTNPEAYGTLYKKEMKNSVTRRAIFKRVANTDRPKKNWRMKRVSGSLTVSPDTQLQFKEIIIKTTDQDYSFTDPLAFVHDLELIPRFVPGETVQVFVQVTSLYGAKPDTVVLRYRNNQGMIRARKSFRDDGQAPDQTAGDGIYSGEWQVGQRRGIFHAFADAFDEGTINDSTAPYNALVWGFTYFVKK